jgi:DNA polymerase-3 subunit delta'
MSFDDVPGQDRAKRVLKRALAEDKLPHAYLFYGAEGLGRFETALTLAQALLCEAGDGDACGECSACTRVGAENHPDVIVVRPESRKGTKEWIIDPDLGTIRIEQIRDFQRWISVRSFEGGWKVGIFEGADRMNPAASNALLKTLEEPPPASLLVLVSPSRGRLLPTIVSRCQPVHFAPLPRQDLEAFLSERQAIPKEELSLVSALSEGSPGKALALDSQWVTEVRRDWMDRLRDLLASGPEGVLMDFADDLSRSSQLLDVLDLYESWYRDLLICGIHAPEHIINRDYTEELAEAAAEQEPGETIAGIDAIRQARREVLGSFNLNKQSLVEGLLLKLSGYT